MCSKLTDVEAKGNMVCKTIRKPVARVEATEHLAKALNKQGDATFQTDAQVATPSEHMIIHFHMHADPSRSREQAKQP